MYVGRGGFIAGDEFGFTIGLYMVFVTKIVFPVVGCPLYIGVFLAQFIFVPVLGYSSFFEFFILIPAVALHRHFYNRGIY